MSVFNVCVFSTTFIIWSEIYQILCCGGGTWTLWSCWLTSLNQNGWIICWHISEPNTPFLVRFSIMTFILLSHVTRSWLKYVPYYDVWLKCLCTSLAVSHHGDVGQCCILSVPTCTCYIYITQDHTRFLMHRMTTRVASKQMILSPMSRC